MDVGEKMTNDSVTDLFDLTGRVALVTGGAGHLGHAMSHCLAKAGAHVFVAGRTEATLQHTANETEAAGGKATPLQIDVTSDESVAKAIDVIRSAEGRLDVVVNNAYSGASGSLTETGSQEMLRTYDVTTVAAHRIVTEALDLLRKAVGVAEDASIINIASMYGLVSPDPSLYDNDDQRQPPDYGTAKASLVQYTRYLATHLASDKIRVNTLTPGPFAKTADQTFLSRLEERIPLKRIGRPRELDGALLFLASHASTYVTGSNVVVDGGWTAW